MKKQITYPPSTFNKRWSILLYLLFFITYANAQYCTISGDETPCEGETIEYELLNVNLLPGQSLEWDIEGGTFILPPGPTTNTVEVIWGSEPSHTLSVTHLNSDGFPEGECMLEVSPGSVEHYMISINQDLLNNCPKLTRNIFCEGTTIALSLNANPIPNDIEWIVEIENSNTPQVFTDYPLNISDIGAYNICVSYTDPESGCPNVPNAECIELKILPKPQTALNVLDFPGQSGPFNICTGQALTFQDATPQQLGITFMREWDIYDANDNLYAEGFGNNDIYKYAFQEAGTYRVVLTQISCLGCFNEDEVIVNVTEGITPQIICPSIICEGQMTSYATDVGGDCNSLIWTAQVGNYIVQTGSGTTFDVDWTGWPISEYNGYGVVTLEASDCDGAYCQFPVSTVIPIIPPDVEIDGPDFLCDVSSNPCYSLPLWPGAFYSWSVNTNGVGSVLGTAQNNSFCLDLNGFTGMLEVSVEVNHPIAGCLASATMDVTVIDIRITGPSIICLNDSGNYFISPPLPEGYSASWSILNEANMTYCSGNDLEIGCTFNDPGNYEVVLMVTTPEQEELICGDETFEIIVPDSPPPFDEIIGQLDGVCAGIPETYSVVNNLPGSSVKWEITNRFINLPPKFGESITVTWNGAPSSLTVIRTINGCESEPFTVDIGFKDNIDYEFSGPTEVCTDAEATYTVTPLNLNDPLPDNPILWDISPSGAGTIIAETENSVTVQWHYNQAFTNLNIKVKAFIRNCDGGFTALSVPVDIVPRPDIIIEGALQTCTNANSAYTVSIDPMIDGEGTWYLIEDNASQEIGAGNTLNYVFTEEGQYLLRFVYKGTGVCPNDYSEIVPVNVFLFPDPIITTPGATCEDQTIRLYTQNYEDLGWTVTYEWKDANGTVIDTTSFVDVSGDPGAYTVTVNNGFCSLTDSISWSCEPPCECTYDASAEITGIEYLSACGAVSVSGRILPERGEGFWVVNDPSTGSYTEEFDPDKDLEYVFTNPGFYSVSLHAVCGENPTCSVFDSRIIEIPLIADFRWEIECSTEDTYTYTFIDKSELLPQATDPQGNLIDVVLTNQEWTIEGPGNPAPGNGGSFSVELLAGETYTVTLAGETNVGYDCQQEYVIIVPVIPELDISPGFTCAGANTTFSPGPNLPPEQVLSYTWSTGSFNGSPYQSFQATPTFSFNYLLPSSPQHEITLTVETIYGCILEQTIPIEVYRDLRGVIEESFDACNTAAILTFVPSDTLTDPGTLQYLWSTGETTGTITASDPGSYTVTVLDAQGFCPEYVTGIYINNLPQGDFGLTTNANPVCEGGTYQVFTQNLPAGFDVEWTTHPTGSFSSKNNFVYNGIVPAGAQEILVTATLLNDTILCGSAQLIIPVNPNPVLELIASVEDCNPLSIKLSEANGLNVLWTNSIGTFIGSGVIEVTEPGTYTAEYYSPEGCSTEESITVNPPIDFTPLIFGKYDLCVDELDGTQCAPGIPGEYQSWQWFNPENGVVYLANTNSPSEIDPICITPEMEGPIALRVITESGCEEVSDPFIVNLEVCNAPCATDDCTCVLGLNIENRNGTPFELNIENAAGVCETITENGLHYIVLDGENVDYTLSLTSGFENVLLDIELSGCNLHELVTLDNQNDRYTLTTNAPCPEPCVIRDGPAELVFAGCQYVNGTNTLFDVIFPEFPFVDVEDITIETPCCNFYSDEILYYDSQGRLHYTGIRTSGIDDLCFVISLSEDCGAEYCFELPDCLTKAMTSCDGLGYTPTSCYSGDGAFGLEVSVFYQSTNGIAAELHVYNIENPGEENFSSFTQPVSQGDLQISATQFFGTDIDGDGLVTIHIEVLAEDGQVLCDDYKVFNPLYICDDESLLEYIFIGGDPPGSNNNARDLERIPAFTNQGVNQWEADDISIYPVPASDFIRIKNPKQLSLIIELLDINGRAVFRSDLSESTLQTIKSSELPAGVYMVRVKDVEGNGLLNQLVPVSH